MMTSKWRRYLYLLVDRYDYPLRRIDASSLFFPSTDHTPPPTEAGLLDEDARLPQPFISFAPSPSPNCGGRLLDFFTLFGRGENKSLIAGADENGYTFIYDLHHQTVYNQRRLNKPKQIEAVSLAVGDALYVMDRTPLLPSRSRCGFESLVYGGEPSATYIEDWRWRCLEPPPYVREPGYKPARITAYTVTVVGGSHVCISTAGIGTYSFDTSSTGAWSKIGKWVLPFRDRAHYVPECDSWLGFSSKTGLLCSVDLGGSSRSTARRRRRTRPSRPSVLEEAMRECKGYDQTDSYIVRLGSSKFCVAKFFEKDHKEYSKEGFVWSQMERFVVLTGFVMDLDGPLRMRKHRSRRYNITHTGMGIGWLF